VSVTDRQSEPFAGITSGSWLALVLTVTGLVVLAPVAPKVVDHVVPAFGIVATNATQLDVGEIPAVTVTVSLKLPVPPVQFIVKLHAPAATVCRGRFENAHVVVVPPEVDVMLHGVPRVPIDWSRVVATQAGDVPLPCR
jgi:hypothetical protein